MPPFPDPASLSPAERTRAVARTLAAGLLRLANQPAVPPENADDPPAKNLPKLSLNCLDLSRETRLNVHTS